MSLMGFQKKNIWIGGWVGGLSCPIFFGFLEKKINFAKPLITSPFFEVSAKMGSSCNPFKA